MTLSTMRFLIQYHLHKFKIYAQKSHLKEHPSINKKTHIKYIRLIFFGVGMGKELAAEDAFMVGLCGGHC